MKSFDLILVALPLAGALYGAVRGIRSSLYLLVTFLAAILAVLTLTGPLERAILDLSGVGSSAYPDGPAVAVLILEDRSTEAFLVSMIPSLLTLFFVLFLVTGGVLLGPILVNPSRNAMSRILGSVIGLPAGAAAALIVIVQAVRLPWSPAARLFQGSLVISAVNHAAGFLIPALAGGA